MDHQLDAEGYMDHLLDADGYMDHLLDAAGPLFCLTGQSSSGTLVYIQSPTGQIRIGFRLKISYATCSLILISFCNHRYS